MDKLEQYRSTIQALLQKYYQLSQTASGLDEESHLALDEQRDQYLWFRSGWNQKKRVSSIIAYLRIQNGKIWVEEDWTNLDIVDDLLAAGIPQSDIVLGFHHPSKRSLTGFATA